MLGLYLKNSYLYIIYDYPLISSCHAIWKCMWPGRACNHILCYFCLHSSWWHMWMNSFGPLVKPQIYPLLWYSTQTDNELCAVSYRLCTPDFSKNTGDFINWKGENITFIFIITYLDLSAVQVMQLPHHLWNAFYFQKCCSLYTKIEKAHINTLSTVSHFHQIYQII